MLNRVIANTLAVLPLLVSSACFEDPAASGDDDGDDDVGTTDESGTGDSETGSTDGTESTGSTETTTETGVCDQAGCSCELADDCAEGLECVDGECLEVVCGDGLVQGAEQCDDGGTEDGDGCDADCTLTEILAVDAGLAHTCVLIEGGRVRCWGQGITGQLGLGTSVSIGDDELPSSVGDVPLPSPALQIEAGAGQHTCALLDDMKVRCWGLNDLGQLGYGNTTNIGDDELPGSAVDVGGDVAAIAMGTYHTCAELDAGALRCWGSGGHGRLGYADTQNIGDDELPSAAGDVPVGGQLVKVVGGQAHTCGISVVGTVRCWGRNEQAQLGYGNLDNVGDDETPMSVGDVSAIAMGLPPLTKIIDIAAGVTHTCVLYETGEVMCWGEGLFGQLGTGTVDIIGDDELPSSTPPIDLPGSALSISANGSHTCAVLEGGDVYCWGGNSFGQLGYGHTNNVGDDELPSAAGAVELGAPVVQVATGFFHTCALTEANEVRCWGNNDAGQLGLGHTDKVGDDELPTTEAPVEIF